MYLYIVMASTLADRWKVAREAKRLSGNELDRRIGQQSGYTSRVERGEKPQITAMVAAKAAQELGVSLDWLVSGIGQTPQVVERSFRYESLREVLERFPLRWSEEAVAAVRTSMLRADSDPGHEAWIERLDRMQAAVKLADPGASPKIPDRGADPLADMDERPASWPPKKTKKK